MKNIYIFTLNGCLHCSYIKKKLNELSIPFHDVEITQNRQLWDQIILQTGYDLTPTIFIQDDKEGSGLVYTPGRDFQNSDEIIEIIKNQYMEKGD
jgi:glutaredoxin